MKKGTQLVVWQEKNGKVSVFYDEDITFAIDAARDEGATILWGWRRWMHIAIALIGCKLTGKKLNVIGF